MDEVLETRGRSLLHASAALSHRRSAPTASTSPDSRHWRLAQRKMNGELRTLVRRALDFHFAVVGLDHRFDQTKAEAEALLRAALVAAIEPLPNPGNLRRRNADAVVLDADDRLLVLLASGDLDSSARRRVLDGVVDQIRQRLLEASAVSLDFEILWRCGEQRDFFFFRDPLVKLDHVADQIGKP